MFSLCFILQNLGVELKLKYTHCNARRCSNLSLQISAKFFFVCEMENVIKRMVLDEVTVKEIRLRCVVL